MQDDEDFERQATAAVLETGVTVGRASLLFFLVGLVGTVAGGNARIPFILSLPFGLFQAWLALRVELDARLFALSGLPAHLAALDRVLARLGDSPPAERGFADRSRGALRLWKLQVVAAVLQTLCVLGGVITLAAMWR
ncbi:MAG: hypothetical protein ACJ76Y_18535 [Thermoanaerobaculia bacterium]